MSHNSLTCSKGSSDRCADMLLPEAKLHSKQDGFIQNGIGADMLLPEAKLHPVPILKKWIPSRCGHAFDES